MKMKKVSAIILALVMSMCMCVSAFAAPTNGMKMEPDATTGDPTVTYYDVDIFGTMTSNEEADALGTTVDYVADANEYYIITVPAMVTAGAATPSDVHVEGLWGSNKQLNMSVSDTVTLNNTTVSGVSKDTSVYLDTYNNGLLPTDNNGLHIAGDFSNAISVDASIAVADPGLVLGSWSGVIMYNVSLDNIA